MYTLLAYASKTTQYNGVSTTPTNKSMLTIRTDLSMYKRTHYLCYNQTKTTNHQISDERLTTRTKTTLQYFAAEKTVQSARLSSSSPLSAETRSRRLLCGACSRPGQCSQEPRCPPGVASCRPVWPAVTPSAAWPAALCPPARQHCS